jgi:SAM-dependent methyltransferase
LVFVYPVPTSTDLENVYEEDYFRSYREASIDVLAEPEAIPVRYRKRLRAAKRAGSTGRLLDIGVGHGTFLYLAREQGWEVQGIDVSRYAAQFAKERFDVDVAVSTLEEAHFPSDHFDLVHLAHVLEHLPDPIASLKEIRRILKPAGRLLVEVPNEFENLGVHVLDSLRIERRPYPVRSTHLFFFDPSTLRRALTSSGFRVLKLRTHRDTTDARPARRFAKSVLGTIERQLIAGSLLEAIAVPAGKDERRD